LQSLFKLGHQSFDEGLVTNKRRLVVGKLQWKDSKGFCEVPREVLGDSLRGPSDICVVCGWSLENLAHPGQKGLGPNTCLEEGGIERTTPLPSSLKGIVDDVLANSKLLN